MWSQVLWNWLDDLTIVSNNQPKRGSEWHLTYDDVRGWLRHGRNFKQLNLARFSDGFLAACSLKRGKNHIARPLLEPLLVTEGIKRHSSRLRWRWCFFWWTVLSVSLPPEQVVLHHKSLILDAEPALSASNLGLSRAQAGSRWRAARWWCLRWHLMPMTS